VALWPSEELPWIILLFLTAAAGFTVGVAVALRAKRRTTPPRRTRKRREREKQCHHKRWAQLDGWEAEPDLPEAKASVAGAEAQSELHREIARLEAEISAGRSRLAEIEDAGEKPWGSIEERMDSAWRSFLTALEETSSRSRGSRDHPLSPVLKPTTIELVQPHLSFAPS